jgi:pimeloyl-ACP methyl ester carboxylesterase
MGLGSKKGAWQRQTKDFGHTEGNKYSCLILDNRGIGESDKPVMRYSTSEMAKDVLEILDHAGWDKPRELHIVGISMGGMIAQELVCVLLLHIRLLIDLSQGLMIPDRIASLSLVSTAAALKNTAVSILKASRCYN